MGKAGRFACIFTPLALTVASLICLILVGLGGTNHKSSTLNNFFFLKADTSNITISSTLTSSTIANDFTKGGDSGTTSSLGLADYYTVALWNYCSGTNSSSGTDITCTKPKSQFYFDPVNVWNLNNTAVATNFRSQLQKALGTYKTAAKWMFISYVVALIATAVEVLVGILAVLSRWGSFFTTIVSAVSSLFLIAFAITATVLFSTLVGAFDGVLKSYNIKASLGHSMFVTVWLAVAFSFASGIFWFVSICCCSGRSEHKRTKAEKTPYTYERMPSPYLPPQEGHQSQYGNVPMGPVGNKPKDLNSAYEPYRHERV